MNPQRILRQTLEDLQRAGVTQVPRELAELVSTLSVQQAPAPASQRMTVAPASASSAPVAVAPVAVPAQQAAATPVTAPQSPPTGDRTSARNESATTPAPTPVERKFLSSSIGDLPKEFSASMSDSLRPGSNLSRDERVAGLSKLAEQVAACARCQELADTRTQTVFGIGNPEADIMYIGEAPGADEDREGEPFIGRAGKLLDKITEASKLTREEIYICNILRCRPPGNRNPTPDEAGNCREYLDAQIEMVDPEYIVCWGSVAAHNLLDTKVAIGKLRGKFFDYKGIKVLCTYHPSYLLRSPGAKKDVWTDMKFLRADMGVQLD